MYVLKYYSIMIFEDFDIKYNMCHKLNYLFMYVTLGAPVSKSKHP